MRAIIVDDEQPILKEFKITLEKNAQLEVVGAYTDPLEALGEIHRTQPEVAFLDIEMRGLSGIELAEMLLSQLPELDIFFVTAFNHYATEAFETNAVDYILKPVRPERLQKALEKLNKRRMLPPESDTDELRLQFFGKFGAYIGDRMIKWSRAKQRELFAYLLQNEGKWIDKYKICDDLWRDSSPGQALSHLQTAVWAVRKTLKEYGCHGVRIEYQSDSYILKLGNAHSDLQDYQTAVEQFQTTGNMESRRKAMALYGDGYLYNDDWLWAMLEREAYARRFEKILKQPKK